MSKLYQPDNTSVQGFEKASDNIIVVWQGDCPKCLLPFNRKNMPSWQVNVWTNRGFESWCESCVRYGVERGICLRYSNFSKEEKKYLKKYVKQQNRQS